ncbi:EAL domain-containing protein [Sulfurimonas sp.]|uniref:EAL domain-containing protein n=1 Tax=Sulfurimonas sp. TaxID=2022749 RepID=UPI00356630DD
MGTLKNTKQKVFISSILLVLILFIVGYIFLNFVFDKQIKQRVDTISTSTQKLFNIYIDRYRTILDKNIEYIVLKEEFIDALKSKNRKKIDEIVSNSYFLDKTSEQNIEVSYYTKTKKESSVGFKNTKNGIYFFVLKSVFDKDRYIGFIEQSIKIELFVKELKNIYKIKSINILNKDDSYIQSKLTDETLITNIQFRSDNSIPVTYLSLHFDISELIKSQNNLIHTLLLVGLFISVLILFFTKKSFDSVFYHFKKHTFTDALTGVGNKQKLDYELSKEKVNVLILMNIKEFSLINELYGISIGNDVLVSISKELTEFAKKYSLKLYRISSDEFAFLKYDDSFSEDDYVEILEELHENIHSLRIKIEKFSDILQVEPYFGVSNGSADDNLVEKSQMALKKAKEKSLPFMAYTEYIDTKQNSSRIIKMKKTLKHALKNNNIVPFFQEIRDRDKNVVKYEALVRLIDFENGKEKILYPGDFLSIAINGGLYSDVAKEVLNQALSFFSNREEIISINFLPSDFFQPKVIDTFIEIVEGFSDPKRIVIEITEEDKIEDFNRLLKIVKRFRKLGVKIAVDDFGSGYANYSHILRLKPDYLKIDGSLVQNILDDEESKILVKSIVHFAQELGIKTVAEYVENEEIFELLKEYGVDEYQGFYFGKAQNLINT